MTDSLISYACSRISELESLLLVDVPETVCLPKLVWTCHILMMLRIP